MRRMSERVSVIICAYNNWPDLELAIQSALCQSHQPVEVIVVDNSSTDSTPLEVTRRFGERIRYVCQPNRGDSGAYNAGARLALGDYLQFLDGDDVLAPDKIERQLDTFRSHPAADIVCGDVRLFQTAAGEPKWRDVDVAGDVDVDCFLRNEGYCVGSVLGVLFRRRALELVGPWDEKMYRSDADYFLRAGVAGCRFQYSPGIPAAFKRVRSGQMGVDHAAMLDGTEALWMKALGYFTEPLHLNRIRFNLARTRFLRAFRGPIMSRRQAMTLCREARRTSAAAVPFAAYLAGVVFILLPGRRFLAMSPRLKRWRRAALRLAGYETAEQTRPPSAAG